MTTPIANFNVVLVGENFPVQTMQVRDFTYRGRQLQEHLRMGPALQAGTRGVALTVLPDRFQVAITEPDDVTIQSQGVQEIVKVFRDYIGRRSATHLGHNAQLALPPEHYEPVMRTLVQPDRAADLLGVPSDEVREAAVTLVSRLGNGVTRKVMFGLAEDERLIVDFNFDHDLTVGEVTLEAAAAGLLSSLEWVEHVHERILEFVAEKGRVKS